MADKYYSSPRWSGEIVECSMPMTFDTYSNCSFGCLYCFSQNQRGLGRVKEAYLHKEARPVNVAKVRRMFLDPDRYAGQFAPYIKQRRVMQWGGLSDQFDGFERRYGVTLELLKFFKEIDYPLCFSTKATWFTEDPRYMDLIRGQRNWNFKFSIITLDEAKARAVERGVPSPSKRLDAIRRIAEADSGGATLRLRPFIIGVSNPTHTDLIREAARRGATALSTEFLCVEQRSPMLKQNIRIIDECAGYDIMDYYRRHSPGQSGYLRLCRAVKRPYIEEMRDVCREVGMRFYVSDAHFKELCCNGSCCGLPEGWNYSRGQITEALMIARERGSVRWSDVSADADSLHGGYLMCQALNFNMNSSDRRAKFYGMTMAQYLRWNWNNPQSGQSPYRMFGGVLVPDGKDANGDLVYRYDGSRSIDEREE